MISETELGKLTVVSPSMPPLTSISSASGNRVSDSLTSSVSLTQCIPQEKNNITENRLKMMERNISSVGETLNRFIEAQRTSREQVRDERRHSTRLSPIRGKYKGSQRSRSPHRRHHIHHIHCRCSVSPTSLATSQSDIDDGSESDFVYHNSPTVTENQSISSQVKETSSSVKDQGVDEETLDIFGEINSNNLVSANAGPAISGQLAEVAKRYWEEESRKSLVVSKIAERLLIPNNCEFVRVPKLNETVAQNRKILPYYKRVDRRVSNIQKSISLATSAILQISNEDLKCQKESEFSFDHKKVVSTAIDAISFMAKATHSLSTERRDRLKPVLNEEVRSLCDFEPTSFEYLFGENMNENLKLAKENYKLSQNSVSIKSRNKITGPSSRTGFKRRPDDESGKSFSSRTQQSLNYQGRKKEYSSRTPKFQKNIKSRRY